ncbi:MAG: M42 family peptidase, partial [Eubacterium sp.]
MLKQLCNINSTSGDEKQIRDYIIEQIKDYCEYSVDNLGSVIAFKKGRNIPKKKVMFSAHMDEVGFIITDIDDNR